MKNPIFTREQVSILSANPFTAMVTERKIEFTLDFKVFAMQKIEQGMNSVQIFEAAGYDPEIIGLNRCYGRMRRIKDEAKSESGLRPSPSEKRAIKKIEESSSKKSLEKQVTKLQKEIDYMREEIEFLKKTSFIRSMKD